MERYAVNGSTHAIPKAAQPSGILTFFFESEADCSRVTTVAPEARA